MESKPKILLISYYWPPSGGGGVHRWLKMSKYLAENIELHVYTPENPEAPAIDYNSISEVHPHIKVVKNKIVEPYSWYKRFTGKKSNEKIYSGFINEKPSLSQKISVWIRGNFFIPDARKWWIKPSVSYLTKYIRQHNIDAIISTGPPHSMHLIGLGLKERISEILWIVDFRDPWTKIDFYDHLNLTKWADSKHKKLERKVLRKADKIVTVSESWASDFEQLSGGKEVEVITNGYDHQDFIQNKSVKIVPEILHIGSMNADRNPLTLWEGLNTLRKEDHFVINQLSIRLIGNVDHSIIQSINDFSLKEKVNIEPFIPHDAVIKQICKAKLLLLIINDTPNSKGVIPGKLFEYLGSNRPVLCIGPKEGDAKKILSQYNHCFYVDFGDVNRCKEVINYVFTSSEFDNSTIDTSYYSRATLATSYLKLIEEIL